MLLFCGDNQFINAITIRIMKKTIIISLFFMGIFSQNCFGQLKVDSVGHVGIGATTTQSKLSIGEGNSLYDAYISSSSSSRPLGIKNNSTGISISNYLSNNISSIGLEVLPTSGSSTQSYYGILCQAGYTSGSNYGLYASIPNHPFANQNSFQAAIYGRVYGPSGGPNASGNWAGYFGGNVAITGTLLAVNIQSPSINSNNSNGSSFTRYSAPSSVTDKLQNVHLYEVYDTKLLSLKGKVDDTFKEESDENTSNNQYASSEKENESCRYTLAADELREVYPELVYEDLDGNVSINYIEMVPLLVQSIKELNAKIESLEKIISNK